jgi:hypothetical protein
MGERDFPKSTKVLDCVGLVDRRRDRQKLRGAAHMTQPLQTRRFNEAIARVQQLFTPTPSVTLTAADTAQLAGLDRQVCRMVLRNLIDAGFLERRPGGMFVRNSSASH